MKKIVFICAAMMAFAATAFAQECEYDQQTGVIKIWKHTGMLKGYFTVNAEGKQVRFSQGNLQYNSDTQKWQFAEHQYDYIGNTTGNTSITVDGKANNTGVADLFGWVGASSSWDEGLKKYGLTSSTTTNAVDGYGNVASESLKSDWGKLMGSTWRTLTYSEWGYLFDSRTGTRASTVNGTTNARFVKATVNGKYGVILFPDGGTFASSEFTVVGSINKTDANYTVTTCTLSQWEALEAKGCVFLPLAGRRSGTTVNTAYGYYRTSTGDNANQAGVMRFGYSSSYFLYSRSNEPRSYGASVRHVKDVLTP